MFGPGGEGHCSMPTPADLTVVIDGGGGEIEIPTGHGDHRPRLRPDSGFFVTRLQ